MNNQQPKSKDVAKQLSISCSQACALMQEEFSPPVRFGCCVQVRPEEIEEFIKTRLTSHETNLLKAELAAVTASSKDQQENHLIEKEIRHE